MDFEIRKLSQKELDAFKSLIRTFAEVFETEPLALPADGHLEMLLKKDSFWVFIATIDDQIAGGLTAYLLPQYYSDRPLAYIYDLAVRTDFQRRGIGKGLVEAVAAYARENGVGEVFVQADEEDDYALEFYHATGANRGKAVSFYYHVDTGK